MEKVDVILTSFNRFDLLRRTLDSFLKYNTQNISRFIVLDDWGLSNNKSQLGAFLHGWLPLLEEYGGIIKFLAADTRKGQIKTLDSLWSYTTSDYVFCMEDDWEFYRDGFIEASLAYLKEYDKCIQLWLREITDTNSHPIEHVDGTMRLKLNHNRTWNGFSFNPGLKRRRDYDLLGSYGQHTEFIATKPWESEIKIGKLYAELGYWAGIGPQGYCHHIGESRGIRS